MQVHPSFVWSFVQTMARRLFSASHSPKSESVLWGYVPMTRLGGVTKCISEVLSNSDRANQTRPLLVQKWLFTCSVSIHYLNQCWLTVICALGNIWFYYPLLVKYHTITHCLLGITVKISADSIPLWSHPPLTVINSVVILLDQLILSVASMPIKGSY